MSVSVTAAETRPGRAAPGRRSGVGRQSAPAAALRLAESARMVIIIRVRRVWPQFKLARARVHWQPARLSLTRDHDAAPSRFKLAGCPGPPWHWQIRASACCSAGSERLAGARRAGPVPGRRRRAVGRGHRHCTVLAAPGGGPLTESESRGRPPRRDTAAGPGRHAGGHGVAPWHWHSEAPRLRLAAASRLSRTAARPGGRAVPPR